MSSVNNLTAGNVDLSTVKQGDTLHIYEDGEVFTVLMKEVPESDGNGNWYIKTVDTNGIERDFFQLINKHPLYAYDEPLFNPFQADIYQKRR